MRWIEPYSASWNKVSRPLKLTWRKLNPLLAVAVVAVATFHLVRNMILGYNELSAAFSSIRYYWLVASVFITLFCTLLGGWEWTLLLSALGHDLPLSRGLRIHVLANLAKYLPGYAWQVIGKVYLGRKEDLPTSALSLSIILEFSFIFLTGLLVLVVLAPSMSMVTLPLPSRGMAQIVTLLGVAGFFASFAFLTRFLVGHFENVRLWQVRVGEIIPDRITLVILAIFLTWLVLGIGFCGLVASVYPLQVGGIPTCVFALVASFIGSLLAIFVPAGWGVREAVLAYILSYTMPPALASLIAILARVTLMVAEGLAFVLVTCLKSHHTATLG